MFVSFPFSFPTINFVAKNVQILIWNNLRSRSEETVCKPSYISMISHASKQKTCYDPNTINDQTNFKTHYNPQGTPSSKSNIGNNVPANVRFQKSPLSDKMDYVHAVKTGEEEPTTDMDLNVLVDKIIATSKKLKSAEHGILPRCKAGYGLVSLVEVKNEGMFLSSFMSSSVIFDLLPS